MVKSKKMVDPFAPDVEMVDELEESTEEKSESKSKKGTLICVFDIKVNGDTTKAGEKFESKDKNLIKHLLSRGSIKRV